MPPGKEAGVRQHLPCQRPARGRLLPSRLRTRGSAAHREALGRPHGSGVRVERLAWGRGLHLARGVHQLHAGHSTCPCCLSVRQQTCPCECGCASTGRTAPPPTRQPKAGTGPQPRRFPQGSHPAQTPSPSAGAPAVPVVFPGPVPHSFPDAVLWQVLRNRFHLLREELTAMVPG